MSHALRKLVTLCLLFCCMTIEWAPTALAAQQPYSPFVSARVRDDAGFLFKRQACPAGNTQCTNINAPGQCCPTDTNCARDQQGNVACCPVNFSCTGVIGSSGNSPTTVSSNGSPTTGDTTAFVSTITVTSTAGVTGGAQPIPTSITGSAAGGGSTIPNAYYPFVYMPTSFGNAAVCSEYYTSCQSASTACFQSLAGANGVTIGGMAGGTTQVGSSGIVAASASSICGSLSRTACYGVSSNACSQFGTTGATGSGFVQAGQGPRETGCPLMVYAVAAGAAAGALGMVG